MAKIPKVLPTSELSRACADEVDGAAEELAQRNAALADRFLTLMDRLRTEMRALRVVIEQVDKEYPA